MSKYILKNIHWFALSTAITIVTTFINIYIPTLSGQAVKDILSIGDFEMLKGLVIQILILTALMVFLLKKLFLTFETTFLNPFRDSRSASSTR
jgi:ABC-type multidrug transport system fused ATPase/permease subunit